MILNNVQVDFHNHGWRSTLPENHLSRVGLGKLGELIINKLASPKEISMPPLDRNKVLFLLDYFYPKYDRMTSDLGLKNFEKGGFELYTEHKSSFIGITDKERKKWFYIVRGVEMLTDNGHVISAGTSQAYRFETPKDCYYPGPSLEAKLKQAKDNDAIIIPPHPLSNLSFFEKFILKSIVRDPSGPTPGLSEKNLREYADYWDAIEVFSSSMSEEQSERAEKIAEGLNIPTVANSDGPFFLSFHSYNLFEQIDFSNPEKMRESIRQGLTNQKYKKIKQPFGEDKSEAIKHLLISFLQRKQYL